jgi:hypothetical protein
MIDVFDDSRDNEISTRFSSYIKDFGIEGLSEVNACNHLGLYFFDYFQNILLESAIFTDMYSSFQSVGTASHPGSKNIWTIYNFSIQFLHGILHFPTKEAILAVDWVAVPLGFKPLYKEAQAIEEQLKAQKCFGDIEPIYDMKFDEYKGKGIEGLNVEEKVEKIKSQFKEGEYFYLMPWGSFISKKLYRKIRMHRKRGPFPLYSYIFRLLLYPEMTARLSKNSEEGSLLRKESESLGTFNLKRKHEINERFKSLALEYDAIAFLMLDVLCKLYDCLIDSEERDENEDEAKDKGIARLLDILFRHPVNKIYFKKLKNDYRYVSTFDYMKKRYKKYLTYQARKKLA